jgi:hypothetical protein
MRRVTQIRIRTAISRFVRWQTDVVPSVVLISRRIMDRPFAALIGSRSPFEALLLFCRVSAGGDREARHPFLRQT